MITNNNPGVFNKDRFNLLGNTYPVKDRLKAIGARWDANSKVWFVMGSEAYEKALAIVNAQPSKNTITVTVPDRRTGKMTQIEVIPYSNEERAEIAEDKKRRKEEDEKLEREYQNRLDQVKSELLEIGLTQQGIDRVMQLNNESHKIFNGSLRELLERAKYTDLNKKAKMFAILEKYELM